MPRWPRRAHIVLLGCCAALMVAPGCRCERGQRLEVAAVAAFDRSGHEEGLFDGERAREALEQALSSSRRFVLARPDRPGVFQAELTITLATEHEAVNPGETGLYRGVQVELLLSRWQDNGVREKLSTRGEAFEVQEPESLTPAAGFARVLRRAVRDAVANLESDLASREYSIEQLAGLLSSPEAAQRLTALKALRERRAPQLVPRVIDLLQDPVPEVVLEAVGVLVVQGDVQAVEPLIRATQARDQLFLLQTISALAELGGPVAKGYLFTLSAGHDSPAIRERAARALQEAERPSSDPARTAADDPRVRGMVP